jgi:multidrug efflux pump subunit AcrA (membrane-fusion protein)
MKFLGRALSGLVLFSVTVGLIGLGVWKIYSAVDETGNRRPSQARERDYNVDVATIAAGTVTPVISAYGQIRAWRMLEIRAAEKGPIIDISRNFRDGAIVKAGELLFRVDPTDFARRVRDAEIALAQAKTDWSEAKDTLSLSAADVKIARRQLALKKSDLQRKTELKRKGFVAEATLEATKNETENAQQALSTKLQSQITAGMRIQSGGLAVERAKIILEEANKALRDTVYLAPFAGPLNEVIATLGKRVSENEKLGVLIDPASLEVSFRVSDEEFGRLLADGTAGTLRALTVKIRLDLGSRKITIDGFLDRAASVTDLAKGGRTVFARIAPGAGLQIRPGDFVTVEVFEEQLNNVVRVPVDAVTDDGKIFLLADGDRLEVHQARILRREVNSVIVTGVPIGREYVKARQPFLAAGVKVRPLRSGAPPPPTHLVLSKERRDALIAYVKSRRRMPDHVKERILKRLAQPKVPIAMVERFEKRMKGGRKGRGR